MHQVKKPANESSAMRFLRLHDLIERLGISRATVYRWEKDGLLPPRRQIGPNAVGWLENEIDEFIRGRPVAVSSPAAASRATNFR